MKFKLSHTALLGQKASKALHFKDQGRLGDQCSSSTLGGILTLVTLYTVNEFFCNHAEGFQRVYKKINEWFLESLLYHLL